MKKVKQYDVFEVSVNGPEAFGSHAMVDFTAVFTKGGRTVKIKGFYNGNGEYVIRFMPDEMGIWHYEAGLILPEAGQKTLETINVSGDFECVGAAKGNHGPVVVDGLHFRYADGTPYIPFGTTIYAWIHQSEDLIGKTIETLSKSPFNKVRMCVLPKSMMYNNNEPELFPFEKDAEGKWDVNHPDFRFWMHLEQQLKALLNLAIEADLILFHPYDRWGFSGFSREESLIYVDYCIRRLAAFRNIWWSLANEYDLIFQKNTDGWEALGEFISREDPNRHLLSVHNCIKPYDASKPWVTHSSIQTKNVDRTRKIRDEFAKPVMIDECRYEGDIQPEWGNISGFEMVHRFWSVMLMGGYCTHGETFHRDDEILWWAKGGELRGESVKRIAFMKGIMDKFGIIKLDNRRLAIDPNNPSPEVQEKMEKNPFIKALMCAEPVYIEEFLISFEPYSGWSSTQSFVQYFGRQCRCYADLALPEDGSEYSVEVIDIWEMTRTTVLERANGKTRVPLPGKEGIAVLAVRL